MGNNIRKLFLLVFVVFYNLQVNGQSSYVFHHLQTDDGLSNSHVNAILKDSYGFLWIGTESGLDRYDGYGFKVYTNRPNTPNSLLTNDIIGLSEDGLGNIWIDVGFGYMVYDRDKDCFVTDIPKFLQKLSISVGNSYKIYVDRNHDLWVLSDQKVFYFDTRKKTLKVFRVKLPESDITTLNLSDDGESLYVISKGGSLWQLDKTGKITWIKLPDFVKKKIENSYNRIYVDSYNGLWIFSDKSDLLYYRENSIQQWRKVILRSTINTQNDVVQSILDDENGHVWICTDHKGVFLYDRNKKTLTNIRHDPDLYTSIASDNVDCIYRDNNGTIWLGHNKTGISYFNESFQNIINVQLHECRNINAILEDKKGNIWIGTDGEGLFVKDKISNSIQKLPMPNFAIVSLLEDSKGRVWIGTYQHGLFCYENGKLTQLSASNSSLANNNIWNLQEDCNSTLWVGSLNGRIQCLNPDNRAFDFLKSPDGEIDNPLDMYYDGGDKLYVGTTYGLYVKNIITGKQKVYLGNNRGTQKFKQPFISNVYKDREGNLWLGHAQGITVWDLKKDTLYYIDKASGLCDNIIHGIVQDNYGNILVTTSNGLSILSETRDKYGNLNFTCRNYSTKDGLKNNYFNSHSICKLRNGDILLGGADGYTLVNSNKMSEKNQPLAKITFTELKIEGHVIQVDSLYNGHKLLKRSLEQTTALTFRYDDKLIALYFTTGDLLNADRVEYVYKLEGFNNQWMSTQENKIEFSSLPPGNYRLLMKACNSDGTWNEIPTVLNIKVTPPFYWSWWSIALYILMFSVLVIYIIQRAKKHHRTKLEQQRIRLEHEQKISLNEMKLRFFTNISHDLRTPLTLIMTPIQMLLNEVSDERLHKKLYTMNKNAEQLLQLINSLLDFRKLDVGAETLHLKNGDIVNLINEIYSSFQVYAADRQITFTLVKEMESLSMQFDSDKVQKILINLLSNAFKYTPDGGNIIVSMHRQQDNISVSVSDTGSGISDAEKQHIFERFFQVPDRQEKTGSGIGLHIVNEYVRMHGGVVSVVDNVPVGSVFTFTLPFIEADASDGEPIPNQIPEEEVPDQPESPKIPTKATILFVDDNRDLCDFMSDSLSDEYVVLTAHNGQEAMEQLNAYDVNIVVSDVMMPNMSGTELCKLIKTNILWSHIPVILLTARTAEESQIEGLELGADDYITKPFNLNILKLRVRKFIEWTEKCHIAFSEKVDISPSEITITSLDQQLIEKAIKVVEENMSDTEFSVETLGYAVGMSRSHLYKKLMNITGKGPAEFIRTVRLKRGRQLLEKSQLQIAEIAYAVGFNSPKIFTKNFRMEFGISPSEYLRSLKNPRQND
ncbi:hybrid sensor histidine kinase/response regulator [Microbacter margulisiae]|uniref:histidine kinase n=1 Tax=Microbacter margulisiae TaxID=1350067 RepID=A0A7W5DSW6_9PORP|nr:two-component regulator propeller domain-containing protein [Microbacter margulisiae]MBB3188470.1 signal transduction histidine kinase/ligand-binding sensor domain-containing protein/DNA-binding response OmpR family regulator [Microbacter margulisiae]